MVITNKNILPTNLKLLRASSINKIQEIKVKGFKEVLKSAAFI